MPVVFTQPLILITLIAVPVVALWLTRVPFPGLSGRRKTVSITLRCLILALLILALAGISIRKPIDKTSVIFAVDHSDSITGKGKEKAYEFVNSALRGLTRKTDAGIVVFGADALVERYPSKDRTLGYISSTPKTNLTNIAEAINLGNVMFPQDSKKHLVLLSDGNENAGDIDETIQLLKLNNIRLSAVLLPSLEKSEIIVTSLKTPPYARVGEKFTATVKVDSDVHTTGHLQLFQDDRPVKSIPVEIKKGLSEHSFELDAEKSGFKRFRAQIDAKADRWAENNEASSITIIDGPPGVLIVEGVAGEAANLAEALKNSKVDATIVAPNDIAATAAGFAKYQSVVLVNVSAEQLGDEKMKALRSYVRDTGGGLVAIGGGQSFGIGGYIDTPLEDALPVTSDIESRRRLPSVALVLIVDKSGSMGQCHCSGDNRDTGTRFDGGVSKVELSKIAIVSSAKVLGKTDYFGVIAVDDKARWVVPLKKYRDKSGIDDMVGSLYADGGQVLEAGLDEAYKKLKNNKAQIKHVIMLTDGWTGMDGLNPVVRNMKRRGITFSTVAAGGGASHILKELARVGRGRYYPMTTDWDIPKVITKETTFVSRPYIQQRLFYPKLADLSPIVKSFGSAGAPPLKGYIATTPKDRAEVVLASDQNDPVLATWQYGLGTSVAWLSDAKNQWSSNWVSWENFDDFWSSLTRYSMPQRRDENMAASIQQSGKDAVISVTLKGNAAKRGSSTGARLRAKVARPDFTSESVTLEEVAPGKFEGRFEASQKGTYLVNATAQHKNGATTAQTLGHVVSYSSEYRFREPNRAFLARVTSATGGGLLRTPEDVFKVDLPDHYSLDGISWQLLLAVFILFFLDIAMRRIAITREDLIAAREYLATRWSGLVGGKSLEMPVEKEELVSRLEEAKKRASERWDKD